MRGTDTRSVLAFSVILVAMSQGAVRVSWLSPPNDGADHPYCGGLESGGGDLISQPFQRMAGDGLSESGCCRGLDRSGPRA
jgi:hypothetical protein